jgi:cysteine synthase
MARLGLETEIVDAEVLERVARRFRDAGVVLPTFAQLADPTLIPLAIRERLAGVDADAPHPLNLFRVHWYNDADRRGLAALPGHLLLSKALTGVDAPIVVALGRRFPMIGAHKVLAAYGCLVPRLSTGQFDPTAHKAVWPSTGNYCRGGVAISRILGCRGVAVLPEGMSRERFAWLEKWVADPADIVKTPGSESNVKEIYDKCAELDRDPANILFNQFCELGNYLVHYGVTGRALAHLCDALAQKEGLRPRAFIAATGSAGTLAAGDHLKERFGTLTVAVEAVECPTLLANGFGEHNIQGIGDKHVPLIHNVMATDVVVGVSDRATDGLHALFQTPAGRAYLGERHGVPAAQLAELDALGLSGICNVLAAIKVAQHFRLGPQDLLVTVATDDASLYGSELARTSARDFPRGFDTVAAAETWGRYLAGQATDHLLEATFAERNRIFNLGYFTWVEQQGVSLAEFEARRRPEFWKALRELVPRWDARIEDLNRQVA